MAKKSTAKVTPETNLNKQEEKAMETFKSMCGEDFDPKAKSTCNRMCKDENPDAFESCSANHRLSKGKKKITKDNGDVKVVPVKERKEDRRKEERREESTPEKKATPAKKEKKPRKVKEYDMFGDGRGTLASQINSLLICGATLEEILSEIGSDEFTGTNQNRVRAHFYSLKVADMARRVMGPLEIFRDKESGRYFIDDTRIEFFGDCDECGNGPVKQTAEVSEPKKKAPKKK